MTLILLGPPGVGKGTQGVRIAAHYQAPHISTGNMLREAVERGTELGLKVKSIMDRGELVPDDVMIGVVADRMRQADVRRGFVLDGFPRTVPQAAALDGIMREQKLRLDAALVIDASVETIVTRLSGRRVCTTCSRNYHVTFSPPKRDGQCDDDGAKLLQRDDDREEVIRDRLHLYARKTAPLVDFYRKLGLLCQVGGDGTPDEVFARIVAGLARCQRDQESSGGRAGDADRGGAGAPCV